MMARGILASQYGIPFYPQMAGIRIFDRGAAVFWDPKLIEMGSHPSHNAL
jgi:hypothetical protein